MTVTFLQRKKGYCHGCTDVSQIQPTISAEEPFILDGDNLLESDTIYVTDLARSKSSFKLIV